MNCGGQWRIQSFFGQTVTYIELAIAPLDGAERENAQTLRL